MRAGGYDGGWWGIFWARRGARTKATRLVTGGRVRVPLGRSGLGRAGGQQHSQIERSLCCCCCCCGLWYYLILTWLWLYFLYLSSLCVFVIGLSFVIWVGSGSWGSDY